MKKNFLNSTLFFTATLLSFISTGQIPTFYGSTTANYGGTGIYGSLFKINGDGTGFTELHEFTTGSTLGNNGITQGLGGNIYYVMNGGGNGSGSIHRYNINGTDTMLFVFTPSDGNCIANTVLMRASNGKFYGCAGQGGANGWGTLFSFDEAGVFTKLHDFEVTEGRDPKDYLMEASNGLLYGVTHNGGATADGVIFSYDIYTNTLVKEHDFNNTVGRPSKPPVQAGNGKLYGVGGNVLYCFDPITHTYTDKFFFDGTYGNVQWSGLTLASNGKLYGTTDIGSVYRGAIFSYDITNDSLEVLRYLTDSSGVRVFAAMTEGSDGKLYGVASSGGTFGGGVVFKFDMSTYAYTVLQNLDSSAGVEPYNSLIELKNLNLNIAGKCYVDFNNDCIKDSADQNIANLKIIATAPHSYQQQMTNSLGEFNFFETDSAVYEVFIDTINLPLTINCPSGGKYSPLLSISNPSATGLDFSVRCNTGFDLAAWSISATRFRSGIPTNVNIHVGSSSNFYGLNCSQGISGSVTVVITGPANYVSPAPGALAPTTVSGNTLTYNIADFGTIDFNSSFGIIVLTNMSAAIGETICFTVTVTPITGDDFPSNNIQTHCFVVVGSFDPNDKQVYPLSDVDVNGERWLTYTVNFQNTGTDTAYHIYITDTLDADLDVSTFQLLAYSHQPLVQLKENTVRFNFPNIMLVDSNANEPLSHGYVQYKVKVKSSAPVGTVINNTAYIYFDFNAPVVTNTTSNTLAIISGIEATSHEPRAVRIYPNPANGTFTIDIDKSMIGSMATITDLTGRKFLAVPLEARSSQLEAGAFPTGVYFVTVTGRDGRSATKKLVIQK